jgi:LacI family transcriptional regulator
MIELLKNDDVAGAIIERDPFAEDDDVMIELAERKHLVFVDAPPAEGVNADHVGTANLSAARTCVEHLIELGHKRIVCVTDSDLPEPIRDRMLGYSRAMKLAGLESHAKAIVAANLPEDGDLEAAMGGEYAQAAMRARIYPGWPIRSVQAVLSMDPLPTALFVCHDAMAFWISALLEGKGYRVPGDFSVVGFDWIANLDASIPDVLTTAWQDFEGFGRLAADLLLDRLQGETQRGPRQLLLSAPLIVRSSTASDLAVPSPRAAKEPWAEEPKQLL